MKLRLLLVEDSPDDEFLLLRQLRQDGLEVEHLRVETASALEQALEQKGWDVVVSDYNLPGFDGLKALARVKETRPELPFVIVSGTVGEDTAVEAMKGGADDYVMKGNLKRLASTLRRVVSEARLKAERKSLEEQVRQSQKMELVGQLAGAVAHDFNNLLTVILNFSQFAHDDLPERHKSREDLKEVIECGKRAAQLTRQLLTFSRKSVSDPAMIELTALLQSSDRMLRRLIGPRIDYATLGGKEVWVKADRGQLEQVVVNLVVNARDAMPEGGKLTVEVAACPPEPAHPKPRVMLAVTDTGCGMSEEIQQRIFEPFFSTKAPGTGTGLGLSTTLGIVKQYGGEISVYSAPGRGTTFKVYLPRADEHETPAAPLPSTQTRGGTETVLVVEDQDPVRQAVVRTLSAYGYKVLEAARPKDALLILEGHPDPVHLVLSDLVLPEMSGAELVDKLRSKRRGLAVLFTSGFAGGALGHQGVVGAGMSFLQKPFTPEALTEKVRAALDSSHRSNP